MRKTKLLFKNIHGVKPRGFFQTTDKIQQIILDKIQLVGHSPHCN